MCFFSLVARFAITLIAAMGVFTCAGALITELHLTLVDIYTLFHFRGIEIPIFHVTKTFTSKTASRVDTAYIFATHVRVVTFIDI